MTPAPTIKPHVIAMLGLPASGKTRFATQFARIFKAPFVESDTLLEYAGNNSDRHKQMVTYMLGELLKTRHTIVVEGLASTNAQRTSLKKLAGAAGYATLFIWVQVDERTSSERLKKRTGSSPVRFEAPHINPGFVVISGRQVFEEQVKPVLRKLSPVRTAGTQAGSMSGMQGMRRPMVGRDLISIRHITPTRPQ